VIAVRDLRRVAGLIAGLGLALSALAPTVAAQDKSLSVRLISPSASQTVAGRVTFVVEVNAEGLFSLHTRVDGREYGSAVLNLTSGSFDDVVDTSTLTDGLHAVQAIAEDEFGNVGKSAPAIILVSNRRAPASMPMTAPMPSPINYGNTSSIGNTLRAPAPIQNSAKNTATGSDRPRVETMFSDMRSEVPTICRGKDPYANVGGGRCKNGEWVPIDPASAATEANAAASKPTASSAAKPLTDATTAGAKTSSSAPSPAGKVKTAAVPCSEPDPFSVAGGVGLCVDGTWLELWPAKSGRRGK
jgi:hypothetical protein